MPRHNPLEDVIRTLGGTGGAQPASSNLTPGGGAPQPRTGPSLQPQGPQQQQIQQLIRMILQNPELLQQLLGGGQPQGPQPTPMPQMRQPPSTVGPF